MQILNRGVAEAIFSQARGTTWIGGIHALSRNLECIPVLVDGQRFLVEFTTPTFLTQTEFYEHILYPTTAGGSFIPKLEHRVISISQPNGGDALRNLCRLSPEEAPRPQGQFQATVRGAVLNYYRSAPHANQFFFRATPEMRSLLFAVFHPLPADVAERYEVRVHEELAAPFLGFTLVSKLF